MNDFNQPLDLDKIASYLSSDESYEQVTYC